MTRACKRCTPRFRVEFSASPWTAGKDGLSPSCCARPYSGLALTFAGVTNAGRCRAVPARKRIPACKAAPGCKVKAKGTRPDAFNTGVKPHLVTLRTTLRSSSLTRKPGGARESIVAEALRSSGVCYLPKAMRRERRQPTSRRVWQAAARYAPVFTLRGARAFAGCVCKTE